MGLYGFKEQFEPHILDGSKTHTIRADRAYPDEPGDTMYLYIGLRTPRCRPIFKAPCVKRERIVVAAELTQVHVWVEENRLTFHEKDQLAWRDGFRHPWEGDPREGLGWSGTFALMMEFWKAEHLLPFYGHIFHWDYARREPLPRAVRCSECLRKEGAQHRPSCHRQGLVTAASDYRETVR